MKMLRDNGTSGYGQKSEALYINRLYKWCKRTAFEIRSTVTSNRSTPSGSLLNWTRSFMHTFRTPLRPDLLELTRTLGADFDDWRKVHSDFEDETFSEDYKPCLCSPYGICLWKQSIGANEFTIRLQPARRRPYASPLEVVLCCDAELLHRMCYCWVDSAFLGLASGIVPLIILNEGRGRDERTGELYRSFQAAYPKNTPGYFCAAALGGIAISARASSILSVTSKHVPAGAKCPASTHAYDQFWNAFDRVRKLDKCFVIKVPFKCRNISKLPVRTRDRYAYRQRFWNQIGESAGRSLSDYTRGKGFTVSST